MKCRASQRAVPKTSTTPHSPLLRRVFAPVVEFVAAAFRRAPLTFVASPSRRLSAVAAVFEFAVSFLCVLCFSAGIRLPLPLPSQRRAPLRHCCHAQTSHVPIRNTPPQICRNLPTPWSILSTECILRTPPRRQRHPHETGITRHVRALLRGNASRFPPRITEDP